MNIEELRERIARAKPNNKQKAIASPFIIWFARKHFDAMSDEELKKQWAMFEIERGEEDESKR